MTVHAQAPIRPDQTFLRRAWAEAKLGHYSATLQALTPYQPNNNDQTDLLRATCLAATGRIKEAASLFCALASKAPTEQHPLHMLADLLIPQERRHDLLPVCRAALKLTPQDARLYDLLGDILLQLGQYDAGIENLRHSVTLRPDNSTSLNLLAMALYERGKSDEALALLNNTLTTTPDHAGTLSNIGCILSGLGRLQEALTFYNKAIHLYPDHAQIRLNHSIALLKAGRYAQGWREHEWRLQLPGHTSLPPTTLMPTLSHSTGPQSNLHGKRILITQEEGLGDTLMYLRYIEPLAQRGAITHLWVPQTLGALCRRVRGAAFVQVGGSVPEFDWHCPFISLPRVFSATSYGMGAAVPYLKASARKVKAFAKLVPQNGKLNVGLVWGGAPRPNTVGPHMTDRKRSMPLATLAPLAKLAGLNLISLQKGPYAHDSAPPPAGMTLLDPTPHLHTLDDTAALLMSIDVLVSVDTSCVHLAGGLGRPVILLDRFDNCWRWLHGTPNSPWYPTLRIIRQTEPRQWDPVIAQLCQALTAMAHHKKDRTHAAN